MHDRVHCAVVREVNARLHKSMALDVADASAVGAARRTAVSWATSLGFNETQQGAVAIVAAEVTTNIARHAGSGRLVLRTLEDANGSGLEILALDKGPGMRDPVRAAADGYSTTGTPGTGLGAITRMASFTELYSSPDLGTAVVARFWSNPPPAAPAAMTASGVVCVAMPGEEACGDDWALLSGGEGRETYIVADGLGHGIQAADAAGTAIRVARAQQHLKPVAIVESAHAALRTTRGAALAVADLDLRKRVLRFVGVGNIAGSIIGPDGSKSLVSHNGTVGHEMRRTAEFVYPFPFGSTLLLMTDGISTQARLDAYPGLVQRHPALIAGVLYRDFFRGRDDATVLVVRPLSTPAP
jgi:anti-sigma regulatory factor (Ser/Thr protein kinase)